MINLPRTRAAVDYPAASTDAALLLQDLLNDQQNLSAVEKFAQQHAHAAEPAQARYYRDLLPARAPQPGQQYAFEVDLDACTGCKACVTACHSLNGLDEDETWRSVGLLVGGTDRAPIFQTVTTACHHCAHPACMDGCPVKAYDKDWLTGIVKHLDDQCIGCQYCILKCPYDVPQYSASRGIVRKCDMCSSRLSAGEAPACVQACPSEAIRIKVVDVAALNDQPFLTGCPDPSYTRPATLYKKRVALPSNAASADAATNAPQPPHWSLVFMLVLTQWSVGAFAVDALSRAFTDRPFAAEFLIAAVAVGLVGMHCALLHLGRPLYAFRAILNLRTSWLSREVAAFGVFAPLALGALFVPAAATAAALAGLAAVFCSAMIYIDTRRPFWAAPQTLARFFGTAAWLGCSAALIPAAQSGNQPRLHLFCGVLFALSSTKMLFELRLLAHLDDDELTMLRKSALLLTGALRGAQTLRYLAGITGGVVLPCALLSQNDPGPAVALAGAAFVLSLLGELTERYLFFRAVAPLKMPGGLPA